MQCFTFEDARRIPQLDKIGKDAAFRTLRATPEHFQWWLLEANLGPHTAHVIGNGLIAATFVEHSSAHAVLRFHRFDGSTVDVELVYVRERGFKTLVHG